MSRILTVIVCCLFNYSAFGAIESDHGLEVRKKIGPVYAQPVTYKDDIFFLATTGGLYKGSAKSPFKSIFRTKLKTVSGIGQDKGTLYFGDGLHDDENSNFYSYDSENKKLNYQIKLKGHVEKTPVVLDDTVIVGLGPGGVSALKKQTGEVIWNLKEVNKKILHVDSTPVVLGGRVFVGSIYEFKAIICVDLKSGKVIWTK